MEIRASKEGEAFVLAPDGSLAGAEETSALEARLVAAQKAGARQLVVDCTNVGQLTSAALRALLATSRKLARAQGRLVLFGMNAKVKKAFAISGFDKDFTVVETRDQALHAVAEPVALVPKSAKPAAAPPLAAPPAPPPAPAVEAPVATPAPPSAVPRPGSPPDPSPLPAPDTWEALADSLLDALGRRAVPSTSPGAAGIEDERLEAVATALLTALGASRG